MTDIKEEIFSRNTTLFEVLDEEEVTSTRELISRVDTLEARVDQDKLQLDGLARLVDTNQANNEARFVDINTKLVALENLDSQFRQLQEYVNTSIENIDSDFVELTNLINSIQSEFDEVKQLVTDINIEVGNLADRVDESFEAIQALRDDVAQDLILLRDNRVFYNGVMQPRTRVKVYYRDDQTGANVKTSTTFQVVPRYGQQFVNTTNTITVIVPPPSLYLDGAPIPMNVQLTGTLMSSPFVSSTFSFAADV